MLKRMMFLVGFLFVSNATFADCRPKFNFTAGRDGRGLVDNIVGGESCRISVYRSSKAGNAALLQSAQLVRQPAKGAVSFEGTSAIFVPNAGFSGRDSMVIRYNYLASDGLPIKSDIRFRIVK